MPPHNQINDVGFQADYIGWTEFDCIQASYAKNS